MSEAVSPPPTKSKRPLAPLIGLVIVIGIVATFFLFRSPNEPVTRDRLTKARELWLKNESQNYDLEVTVSGRQGATYEVRVRDGKVTEALRNHVPLKQERTFRTWSGPGMFDTMETDVDTLEFALANPNDPKRTMLTLRAHFDDKTGLPMTYLRSQWGTNMDVSWKVTRFEPK